VAFQIYDKKGIQWLREEEYAPDVVDRIEADSLEQLADKLATHGLEDRSTFLSTVSRYNDSVRAFQSECPDRKFDPAVLDGLSTQSSKAQLQPPKSNWARTIEDGPFLAVLVTEGTFQNVRCYAPKKYKS
jgi:hypothetical protein